MTNPMPNSPDYDALLDELAEATYKAADSRDPRYTAARSSLKDYVAKIEAENERLAEAAHPTWLWAMDRMAEACPSLRVTSSIQSRLNQLCAELSRLSEENERLRKFEQDAATDLSGAWEEIRRLRASLPTEDEINFLYGIPLAPGCTPEVQIELDRICEKLRSAASPETLK